MDNTDCLAQDWEKVYPTTFLREKPSLIYLNGLHLCLYSKRHTAARESLNKSPKLLSEMRIDTRRGER